MKFRPLATARKTKKNSNWMKGFVLPTRMDELALSQYQAREKRVKKYAKLPMYGGSCD